MEEFEFSNAQIARMLRQVAAALTLSKANSFEVRAYQNAADSIEHSDTDLHDLWEEKKLDDLPGLGKSMQSHINELFETGKVKHFETVLKKFEPVIFQLIDIPGVGPKTAKEISDLGVKDLEDLTEKLESGELVKKGLSAKIGEKLLTGLEQVAQREDRMLLPYAAIQADKILEYLKKSPDVLAADPLGSLRRQVATIGDLDFAVSSKTPKTVVDYFVKMPSINRVIDHGENKATVILNSGLHVDLLVGEPESYGALLQHFTGGKNHNISLRSYAQKHGLSISERGVKKEQSGELVPCRSEEELYGLLRMKTPSPELREDTGEIQAALNGQLPKLVTLAEIKGDFHLHSNFPLEPSHGPGANSLAEIVEKAKSLGYEYLALSDHPPGFTTHKIAEIDKLIAKRSEEVEHLKKMNTKSIRVLNSLEVDILTDGTLSVPDSGLKTLDLCNIGVHSSHQMAKDKMTVRILTALENPYAKILVHPTGRLLLSRPSYDADWEQIFKFCAKNKKALEINAFPNRLDLRDDLVRMAADLGCMFVIDTDAHQISQMDNMRFGVAVARRGWLESAQVINTWDFKKIVEWFNIKQ